MSQTRRALVLSGGGVTGIAWGLGLLAGLARQGLDLQQQPNQPDFVLGTSAGSVVGGLLFQPTSLEALFERQLLPATVSANSPAALVDLAALSEQMTGLFKEAGSDPLQLRRGIGKVARSVGQEHARERFAEVAARFPNPDPAWPEQPLTIVAVDTETGEEKLFTRASGVPLVQAVAASCAVPGVWPPVAIEGRWYTDGGVRSLANADLARGYGKVMLLSLSAGHESNPQLQGERVLLEEGGAEVLLLGPDEASVAAIGPNPLVATTRAVTAHAGAEQGERLAKQVRAFWD